MAEIETPESPGNAEQGRTKNDLPASTQYFIELSWEFKKQALEFSKEYGFFCLRLLSIAHGGAIAAILGFFGTWSRGSSQDSVIIAVFKPAFIAFSVGLMCTIASSYFAYVNWAMHSHNQYYPGEILDWLRGKKLEKEYWLRGLSVSNYLAVGLGFGAGVCFLVGALLVISAV